MDAADATSRPHRPRPRLPALRRTDRSFSVLLGSLVAIVFVIPPLRSRPEATLLVQIFFTLVFVSGLTATTGRPVVWVVGTAFFTGAIALHWVDFFHPHGGLGLWTAFGRFVSFGLLAGLVGRQVFRDGPITVQRIQGAVAVYLLLGIGWAAVYEVIDGLWPGAFRFAEAPRNGSELATHLAYYSFVTLTTMGYGDITPLHPAARSAAILEALTGQLFPAILIARLVAMELSARERAARPEPPA
jgi:hypothetical protein